MENPQNLISLLAPLAVFVPLLGAALIIPLSGRNRSAVIVAVPALTAVFTISMIPAILKGTVCQVQVLMMAPNIWLHFQADPLGVLFAVTVAILWTLAAVYSLGYMADEHKQGRFYGFLLLSLGWTLGVAFAANLLTLLIFYELFSVLTYPLIIHEETPIAKAAGTKYIIYILIGGSLVMLAVMLTFSAAGSLSLMSGGLLGKGTGRGMLLSIFWCFIAGFGVKAALMPLHGWVPDAHPAAPAPFSALLSGVMVATGTFGIGRVIFNVFGASLLKELGVLNSLGCIAAVTIVLAAILAFNQDNLKRRLAYSTISQMGYVVLGLSLLGPRATQGALIHIAHHAFMKGTLFLCAGIIIKRTGFHEISRMAGLGSRLPLTMGAFTIAALGLIGTPPFSGFVSKWYLGLGMLEADRPLYLIVVLGGALLAAVYLLPVVYIVYFKKKPAAEGSQPEPVTKPEAPWSMLGPTLAGAALTIILGLLAWLPGFPLSLAKLTTKMFLR